MNKSIIKLSNHINEVDAADQDIFTIQSSEEFIKALLVHWNKKKIAIACVLRCT